ncbi:MAG: S-methyl-5-thioribose-1-phosphate isomerase, partial [Bdellovibrionales bacterium]|nr:S-methyl-5-thioribose-1-phosphate isomerase [Bdellovibrionales bacterium]
DQTLLPREERWVTIRSPEDMIREIRRLAVRGAPLIGVAAALSLAAYRGTEWRKKAAMLREARPTAVNLMNAIDRMVEGGERRAEETAQALFDEDVMLCRRMAERGAALVNDGDHILTHCNTGGLATVGVGTALGVIRMAHEQGKRIHVWVDETRPLLQGARLTAWELARLGIPHTLICDSMAAFLMARGKVDRVFVGADRIARNGDIANKIGTYGLAVCARHHGIPFHVVAPETTRDSGCATGRDIPIEERDPEEVRMGRAPQGVKAWNPAFDVTPRSLITSIILDHEDTL